ncbi:hypothetical protein [Pseudophaeobacter sp.]|jgi:Cu/Ag efflux pump CusA|uniref:hypothetical protein n=1 Tax=Pseudophaeobacter sp. TaxID=1971739 RepID=UPI0032D8CC9D
MKDWASIVKELPGNLQSAVFLYAGAFLALGASFHFSQCYSGLLVVIAQVGAILIHLFLVLLMFHISVGPLLGMLRGRRLAQGGLCALLLFFVLPVHVMFVELVWPISEGTECSMADAVSLIPGLSLKSN